MFARVVLSLLSIDFFSVQAMSLFLDNIAIFFLDLVLKWNQACNVPKLLWFYNFSFIPKLKSYFVERILNIYISFCKHIFRNCLPLYMYSSKVHTMYTLYSVYVQQYSTHYVYTVQCTVYMYSSTVHTMYTLYSVQCICTAVQYKLCIHCTVYM